MRDAGSISDLGGGAQHVKGTFFIKLKGQFLKIKRALLCLLQNLGGTCPRFPHLCISGGLARGRWAPSKSCKKGPFCKNIFESFRVSKQRGPLESTMAGEKFGASPPLYVVIRERVRAALPIPMPTACFNKQGPPTLPLV